MTRTLLAGRSPARRPAVAANNDLFANAYTLTPPAGLLLPYTGALASNATYGYPESGEVQPASFAVGKTAWWTFVAPVTGHARVDTAGSSVDTEIAVYTGSTLGSLTKVASDSDSYDGSRSLITWLAITAGQTYYVQVGAWNGQTGNYQLNVRCFDISCPHDNFANARTITIPSGGSYADGWWDTSNCTTETGEPLSPAGQSTAGTIWWKYTPAASGTATFVCVANSFRGASIYDVNMALYTGVSVDALTNIAAVQGNQTLSSAVVAGTTYRLQVGNWSGRGTPAVAHGLVATGPAT